MDPQTYQVFQRFAKQGVWQKDQGLIVSLSGGPDSVYLYRFLSEVAQKIPLRLYPVHFNHKKRPQAEKEAEFCQKLARFLGQELILIEAEGEFQGNFQQAARKWRKEELLYCKEKHHCAYIALGHQADDVSETMLFRLLRGTSLFSLEPMKELDPPFFRPLLRWSKAEILKRLAGLEQTYCHDLSNESPRYRRNQLRIELLPLLKELALGDLNEKLGQIAQEAGLLKEAFEHYLPPVGYGDSLPYAQVSLLPTLFARELIHRFLLHHGLTEIHRGQIEEIHSLVRQGRGGWRLAMKGGKAWGEKKQLWAKKNDSLGELY